MWGEVLTFLLPILGTVLTVILTALAKKWIDKLGIERSGKIDDMIDKYVEMGVEAAERIAINAAKASGAGGTGDGSDKKAHAVKTVLAELEQSGIKDVAEQLVVNRIEAYLEKKSPKDLNGVS
jgi:16S rRNA U1498 N3-methylase RsmE